jgi:hypothetical protein
MVTQETLSRYLFVSHWSNKGMMERGLEACPLAESSLSLSYEGRRYVDMPYSY